MSKLEKLSPIGKTIEAPHPDITPPQYQPCTVASHTCEGGFRGTKTTGIIVRFEDGIHMKIEAAYLNEDGTGT